MIGRAFAIAALTTTLLTAPVSAGDQWPRIPCYSGELEASNSFRAPNGDLIVPGTIGCTSEQSGPMYAIALFSDTAGVGQIVETQSMVEYPRASETTAFGLTYHEYLDTVALCLMTDYEVRLSCVLVSDHGNATPLPTIDPMVSKRAIIVSGLYDHLPGCATCIRAQPGSPIK